MTLLKKNKVGLDLPDRKIWNKALVINTTLHWCKDKLASGTK